MAVTDKSMSTTMVRARSEPSCWVPWRRPPTRKARPSTRSRLARIEPTSAARTTSTRPALSEKMQMNSSGRLPRADWSTPVAPGPKRSPSCSTDRPTSEASRHTAPAETTKASTEFHPPYSASPANATSSTVAPTIPLSERTNTGVAVVALMGATVARPGGARDAGGGGGLDYARPPEHEQGGWRHVHTTTGVFVCFEGGEGAGKSTQARALAASLEG